MTRSIASTQPGPPTRTSPAPPSPPGDGTDAGVAVKTRPKTQRPPMYKVLLLNDDFTPMEFVVHILERLFSMTHAQAIEIMLTVHRKGVAVVGVFCLFGLAAGLFRFSGGEEQRTMSSAGLGKALRKESLSAHAAALSG